MPPENVPTTPPPPIAQPHGKGFILATVAILILAAAGVTALFLLRSGSSPTTPPDDTLAREITVKIDGREEKAIPAEKYDCATEGHNKPDMPFHAYRDADGKIHILATNSQGLQFVVDSWDFTPDDLHQNCDPMLLPLYSDVPGDNANKQPEPPRPESYTQKQWLTSTYTLDGTTVYAFVHNEFHGEDYESLRKQGCTSGGSQCWWASITKYISHDKGDSFVPVALAPEHYLAGPWYKFSPKLPDGKLSGRAGTAGHTNVVKGHDGYYYMFTNILSEQGVQETNDMCLLRSSDLDQWYYWDGSGFTKQFADPYKTNLPESERFCAPINAGFRTRSFVYSPEFKMYIAGFGRGKDYFYSTSADLIHWSERTLLRTGADEDAVASIIDHKSTSRNFETVGRNPYLYFGKDLGGGGDGSPRGEIWRVRLAITPID